jgi:catechol 2,3-dioxygenase-like lactoylglutathione lyase family enzyme
MILEGLRYVLLGCRDVERSLPFYRDILGLELSGRFGGFAFFRTGETQLALSSELGPPAELGAARAEFVFGAKSVTQTYEALRSRGLHFTNEPHPVNDANWVVNFRDPDGHLLSVYGAR